eukprot:jgi/Psemu1/23105/gm1.23105_g
MANTRIRSRSRSNSPADCRGGQTPGLVPATPIQPPHAQEMLCLGNDGGGTLSLQLFEDDSQYKVHTDAMKRHVKACLEQQGPNGFSENILTDELITAGSRDIASVFSQLMNKVFIVMKLFSSGTFPDFSETATGDKASLGPIPRAIDVMVNLFLRDSGSQLIKQFCILDPKELTTHFKDYEMKDKWNAFQSALNSVIKINDTSTAGITEYTHVEGEDKVAEGTSFKDDVNKEKGYVRQMVSFFEGLSFHHAPRHFLSGSHSFEQLDKSMNQIRGQEVVCAPTREVGWPSDVSKAPLAFQKVLMYLRVRFKQEKARIFQEVSLDHFANELFVDDNLYKELLPNLYQSLFLIMEHRKTLNKCYRVGIDFAKNVVTLCTAKLLEERDIFVDDFIPEDEQHVKTLLQHYLSKFEQLEQVDLVCGKFLDNVLTSRLSRGPNGTRVPVTRFMVSNAILKAVLGKEEKISVDVDKNLDECLKAERHSLSSNSNPGEPNCKDWLFIFTNDGAHSIQFEEQTPPELLRENYSLSVTRFLNFVENCTYTLDDRLFWEHTRFVFRDIFITRPEILLKGCKCFESFVSGEDEKTLQSNGDSLIQLFQKMKVPRTQRYNAADIAKWDFLKKHVKNFETFIEENSAYSIKWLVFTNKGLNGHPQRTRRQPIHKDKGKEEFFSFPKVANYKEKKVSLNLDHVQDLGYLLHVPRPQPNNVGTQKPSGSVKVLFAEPDPVILYPKFAIDSDEVTITGIPPPGTGVVKSYASKRKDPFPVYPGYMVYKKLPDGTKVKRATWFPYNPYKRKVLKPRFLLDSAEYCERSNELNHGDQNDKQNPFLYYFETGFDALCAQNGHLVLTILNGCNKIDDVRARLNSQKGHFNEEKYVMEVVFPFSEEGNTDGIDHMWAMGIIMAYLLCGYPALKGTEDKQCYNKVDGYTFPPKQWCNLMPEARKHIKECIHFNLGNHPCLTSLWFNEWRTTTEEAITEKYHRRYIEEAEESKRKKSKLKQLANKEKREKEDRNKRNIVHWLHLYEKRWKLPEDLEEYNNYPDKVVIFPTKVLDHGNFRLDRIANFQGGKGLQDEAGTESDTDKLADHVRPVGLVETLSSYTIHWTIVQNQT